MPPNMPRSTRQNRAWRPPDTFAEYQILWSLGRGGMGEVFLGHDKLLERPVAIKFLSNLSPNDHSREQYLSEARAAARLQHPNVVTVYRVGEIDGRPYIVSEYLQGPNLDSLHKPMPWPKALDLGVRLARGLAAAHRSGVLHLDIKPGNAILTESGELKLLDFGLAKVVERAMPMLTPPTEVKDAIAPTMDIASPEPLESSLTPAADSGETEAPTDPGLSPTDSGAVKPIMRPPKHPTRRLRDLAEAATNLYDSRKSQRNNTDSGGWASTIQGTPHYMAPEILLGRQATRASDVYSLGALLFELCSGVTPHYDVPTERVRELVPQREAPPLLHVAPSVHPRFAAIVDRCLRRTPGERFASAEGVRDALEQLDDAISEKAIPEGNPYRGLLPYEPEHHGVFFGRTGEIGTLLERLRSEPCVLVAGDPGVGKSSLCRAGILPLVAARGLTPGRMWKSAVVLPGRAPLQALTRAISAALGCPEETLEQALQSQPSRFAQVLGHIQGPHTGLLIFVDQLEDLLTIADGQELRALAEAIGSLIKRTTEFRVLMAIRQGAMPQMESIPSLAPLVRQPVYDLRPILAGGIKEVIVGPAQAKGVRFEPPFLVNALIDSTVASEGGLPLLQVVLAELWEARKGSVIDTSSLDSIGGFEGAMNRHADHVLGRLSMEQRQGARTVLTALVTPEHLPLRKSGAELLALGPDLQSVLDALVRGRLLAVQDGPESATYMLASPTLCDGWRTLLRWLDEPQLTTGKRSPITAGASGTQELSRFRSDRRHLALTAAPLLLLLVYGASLYRTQRHRNQQVERLVQQGREGRQIAEKSSAAAKRARQLGFLALIAEHTSEADELWRRSQAEQAMAEAEYRNASHALERALNLDGSRSDLRSLLADILLARVVMAEGENATGLRSDLLERLALYDEGGERQRRWRRPGHLIVDAKPPGATVQLARYKLNAEGRWVPQELERIGTAPTAPVELPPGNYLLIVSADGLSPSRQPVLIEYGNDVKVTAELLPATHM